MTDPIDDAPSEVTDLSQACVRFVHDALGFTLDFTRETLPVLDHYLSQTVRGAGPEAVDLMARVAGAYFGEVVRRSVPGVRWAEDETDPRRQRLEFERFFLCFNPVGAALEAIEGRPSEGYHAHFQVLDDARAAVANALERAAEVEEDDYFTLGVRLETLEQVADLVSGLEATREQPRSFGPDVYRAMFSDPAEVGGGDGGDGKGGAPN
jgi:hypothetical protein